MAADDAGEKTEAPTPRRKAEARDRGQVAKSADFNSALMLLGGVFCLRLFGPGLMFALIDIMQEYLVLDDVGSMTAVDIKPFLASIGFTVLAAAGPIMVGLALLSLCGAFLQVGFLLTTKPLEPKLDKLNPLSGFKRIFSTRTSVQMGMNILKFIVVCGLIYVAVKSRLDEVMLVIAVGGWQQLVVLSTVLYDIAIQLAAVLFVIALMDLAWQRYRHYQDLKMSKQEVKEEMRRMEGDPIVKQRQRKMRMMALIEQIRSSVPKADVVVTNPTELAIAIQYDVTAMGAPKVVAKGRDYLAKKIREIALENGIPIVERKPLAQAMFKMVEVGEEIPEQFYQAIAEILAYVYELAGRRGIGAKPATAA